MAPCEPKAHIMDNTLQNKDMVWQWGMQKMQKKLLFDH